ncbi:uncharacterized protein LOC110112685 [Dendrobium catenatum]|uniref:uncharacterized protein LOC110112685 n=1 Tax=Dendrobium catenatum TaxID=906689 RepID=UPI00109F316F|nr:uncharacterized protein LOC110112685 [Dendrobium catenatum]
MATPVIHVTNLDLFSFFFFYLRTSTFWQYTAFSFAYSGNKVSSKWHSAAESSVAARASLLRLICVSSPLLFSGVAGGFSPLSPNGGWSPLLRFFTAQSPGGPAKFNPKNWNQIFAPDTSTPTTLNLSHYPAEPEIVPFTNDNMSKGGEDWSLCLVGYSIGRRPFYEALLGAIKKTWSLKGKIIGCFLNSCLCKSQIFFCPSLMVRIPVFFGRIGLNPSLKTI